MKISSAIMSAIVLFGIGAVFLFEKSASPTGAAVSETGSVSVGLAILVTLSVSLLGLYFITKYVEK